MKQFISKRVREILMESDDKRIVGGVLLKAKDTGRVLLLLRNDWLDDPNLWSMITGNIDDTDDSILDGIKREVKEETQINPEDIEFKFVEKIHVSEKNMDFHYFQGFTNTEIIPKLDEENLDYKWCDKDDLPSPLYPNTKEKIDAI